MSNRFLDGVANVVNALVNRRNPQLQNELYSGGALTDSAKREAFKQGVHNKALRLKTGHALKNTIKFDSTADREFYDDRLAYHVKKATMGMLAFGRGVIVIHAPGQGDDVSKPLPTNIDPSRLKFDSFYGDMVHVQGVDVDLSSVHYFRPKYYNIRGQAFHRSRVIDFRYVEPSEMDLPSYRYGGISETELVYQQLVNDGIAERAAVTMLEKASTFIYKLTGFKDAMRAKQDAEVTRWFERMESLRNVFGAAVIDAEDEATAVNQQLSNLPETLEMSLRRLAMVYGIPLPWLVGENVKGMNAVGENERQIFQDMIEALQSEYLLRPLSQLAAICQLGRVSFHENQGETPTARAQYDKVVVEVAFSLYQMGEDHSKYLEQKGVIEKDDWDEVFSKVDTDDLPPVGTPAGQTAAEDMNVDPTSALNGAHVTAILEIIQRLRDGKISKQTAEKVIVTSFPVSQTEARQLIADVPEGADSEGAGRGEGN
jgi:hypothetical protein